MKLLLDENMPRKLRHHLPGHDVFTTPYMDWAGIGNGKLLALAADAGFEAVLTLDGGIEYEQNLARLPCSVIILKAQSNAFEDLAPLLPAILDALSKLPPRTLVRLG